MQERKKQMIIESQKANTKLIEQIAGNGVAKRAIEVAAVAFHSIAFIGDFNASQLAIVAKQVGVTAKAFKPCPCGHLGHSKVPCVCSADAIKQYRSHISFSMCKGFGLIIDVDEFGKAKHEEPLDTVIARIERAKAFLAIHSETNFEFDGDAREVWRQFLLNLKPHIARQQVINSVAKSIACMDGSVIIKAVHLIEAIQYATMELTGRLD